ncbi:MAG: glutamine amidotransferase [Rhizobiaceae bacterium]|nr:glutamine amidotransferase [Rhizobiaceae bacterium]
MADERPFLILKAGSLAPVSVLFTDRFGDTEGTFLSGCGLAPHQAVVVDLQAGDPLPAKVSDYAGALVSGSSAMVTDAAPWMDTAAHWLRGAVEADLPVLGVCFGHQLMAHAFGGRVGPNPAGIEGGTVEVSFAANDDPLFGGMPAVVDLQAHHYQTVLDLPPQATVFARSGGDRFQAVRYAPRAWSVQFHPELTLPMMELLMATLAAKDDRHGHAEMLATLRPSPEGPRLLQRFVDLARG